MMAQTEIQITKFNAEGKQATLYSGVYAKHADYLLRLCQAHSDVNDINEDKKNILPKQRRNMFQDETIAAIIQKTLKEKCGIDYRIVNPLHYVHYCNNGYVPQHIDKYPNHTGNGVALTVLVYLNEFDGGQTYFTTTDEYVNAHMGDVLIFEGSKIFHACKPVKGDKHILITSVFL